MPERGRASKASPPAPARPAQTASSAAIAMTITGLPGARRRTWRQPRCTQRLPPPSILQEKRPLQAPPPEFQPGCNGCYARRGGCANAKFTVYNSTSLYIQPGIETEPPMETLTPRQAQVLELIRRHIDDTGYPPTRADIARKLGFKSPNAAEEHLKALARKGAIEMIPGTSRGIRLPELPGLPVVGRVAAGDPILAQENIEDHVDIPSGFFRPRADFLLRVRGDSMQRRRHSRRRPARRSQDTRRRQRPDRGSAGGRRGDGEAVSAYPAAEPGAAAPGERPLPAHRGRPHHPGFSHRRSERGGDSPRHVTTASRGGVSERSAAAPNRPPGRPPIPSRGTPSRRRSLPPPRSRRPSQACLGPHPRSGYAPAARSSIPPPHPPPAVPRRHSRVR